VLRPRRVVFVVATVVASVPASADRKGQVVRIERARAHPPPVLCLMQDNLTGVCLGVSRPETGATIVVVGEDRPVAEVQLTKLEPFADNKRCKTMWRVAGKLIRGDVDKAPRNRPNSIIAPTTDTRRTRFIDSDDAGVGSDGGLRFDTDRDGKPDIVFSEMSCERNGERECIAIFTRSGSQLQKIAAIDMQACYGGGVTPPTPAP
jgi:hypothetical protein